ncbi:hypothetical protein F4820DRAFT_436645 [Hypoxylon rubiginosum]|uniref:Uncharacterized protein n=1 Tax=Hypoxylon rubiginosum TaxID=110542 RepID=A0ACB9YMW5_9PEZI|nr:hypothetical protein F4820DRAFT_436645 [Hypoxylon rubiginosum]
MTALVITPGGFSKLWLLLVLMLSFFTPHIHAQDPTTVPIFLPAYKATQWSRLRGSIISSNDVETLYTIFCSPSTRTVTDGEDSNDCVIAGGGKLPFTFFEGPSTLHYGQTVGSDFAVTQACDLAGTTAATCSASTSLGASFSLGPLRGPVDTALGPVVLPSTAVQWGVLTLAQPPLTSTVSGSWIVTYYLPSSSTSSTAAVVPTLTLTHTPTATSEGSAGAGASVSAVETGSGSGTVVSGSTGTSGSSSTSGSATGAGASASTTPSGAARLRGRGSWLAASILLGDIAYILS